MTAVLLVVLLGWCAAVALALPNERQVWRLRRELDADDQ